MSGSHLTPEFIEAVKTMGRAFEAQNDVQVERRPDAAVVVLEDNCMAGYRTVSEDYEVLGLPEPEFDGNKAVYMADADGNLCIPDDRPKGDSKTILEVTEKMAVAIRNLMHRVRGELATGNYHYSDAILRAIQNKIVSTTQAETRPLSAQIGNASVLPDPAEPFTTWIGA